MKRKSVIALGIIAAVIIASSAILIIILFNYLNNSSISDLEENKNSALNMIEDPEEPKLTYKWPTTPRSKNGYEQYRAWRQSDPDYAKYEADIEMYKAVIEKNNAERARVTEQYDKKIDAKHTSVGTVTVVVSIVGSLTVIAIVVFEILYVSVWTKKPEETSTE
ncbi:MAG: hypothetical protein L6427_07025 [Actinomycetia bacterium]|nr:hypothetical protein [Actinomycetes bacterium]